MASATTFADNNILTAGQLNDNFTLLPPIGTIVSWAKSLTGTPALPANWVECNGATLSDAGSPLNGQVMPNLNATNRFLRGSTSSGATGGSETHSHPLNPATVMMQGWAGWCIRTAVTGTSSTLPTYYEVVWIIRVK
jgi:hypothetical protein